ncbi:MAG: hypothetical protein ACRDDY_07915 [Clostridium sp.]|uniref:hypothetical protein n=1 Tax=Clostridium sp. TaxID=1506 RepID=UPI003EE7DDA0
MFKKFNLNLTDKELVTLCEYLGCQNIDDTKNVIDKYELELEKNETENILTDLYSQLKDEAIERGLFED